jgi:hypothetical protein
MPKLITTLFATYLLLTSSSCEEPPKLLSSSRGYFSAFIVDASDSPISNAKVSLFTPSTPQNLILGTGVTDATGFVDFTTLASDGVFNVLEVEDAMGNTSSVVYSSQMNVNTNFTHIIQKLQVQQATEVTLVVNAPASATGTVDLSIIKDKLICVEDWIHGIIPESLDCSQRIELNEFIRLSNTVREEVFSAPLNTEITVVYSVDGGPETTQNFFVNSANPVYEINL